jgi:hypothetical protein
MLYFFRCLASLTIETRPARKSSQNGLEIRLGMRMVYDGKAGTSAMAF